MFFFILSRFYVFRHLLLLFERFTRFTSMLHRITWLCWRRPTGEALPLS